jgi:hypothetical protein
MSNVNNSNKGKKIKSAGKSTLSDSKIKELYSEYIDKEKYSKYASELDKFSKESTSKIKNAQTSLKGYGTKFFGKTKKELSEGSEYFEKNIPTLKNRLNEEFKEGTESVQKNAPKIGRKIKGSFLDTIEKTYGASTIGKQYGTQSVSILKQIGELRENGLITEKEYLQKKKELLDRI